MESYFFFTASPDMNLGKNTIMHLASTALGNFPIRSRRLSPNLLAAPRNNRAQVTHRNTHRKVHDFQDLREEDMPDGHAQGEIERAGCLITR